MSADAATSLGYNTAVVVTGCVLLGVACGVVGCFATLRKRAVLADALGHATLPGIAAAYLVAPSLGLAARSTPVLLAGAAIGASLGALAVGGLLRTGRLRADAAVSAVLSVFFGTGVLLLSVIQQLNRADQGGLSHVLLGQTAAMSQADAITIGTFALAATLIVAAIFKELRSLCFDADFTAVQGWPVRLLDAILMILITLVVVIGLQAVGLLLVVALLIIPAAAARFWSNRLGTVLAAAAIIGGLSGLTGSIGSALIDRVPIGGAVVICSSIFFLASLLLGPARGLLHVRRRARLLREPGRAPA